MKRNIGSKLALYPSLGAIIGCSNEGRPTWTLVAHMGIIGHDRALVSLANTHFINTCIKKEGTLSINLLSEDMLPKADEAGSTSGFSVDKSSMFPYELGRGGTPIVTESPLSMECIVEDVYKTEGFESFICKVLGTYVDEKHLDDMGRIDYTSLRPVLFEFPSYSYLRTGEVIGKCLSFKGKK